jgi:hypothetical protein
MRVSGRGCYVEIYGIISEPAVNRRFGSFVFNFRFRRIYCREIFSASVFLVNDENAGYPCFFYYLSARENNEALVPVYASASLKINKTISFVGSGFFIGICKRVKIKAGGGCEKGFRSRVWAYFGAWIYGEAQAYDGFHSRV